MRLTLFYKLVLCVAITSCTEQPSIEKGKEPTRAVSIAYLKTLYKGSPHTIKEDIYIEGRVVSSDRCRNIYRSLVVQDPTGGIELKLDETVLFERFGIGRMVRVNCNSLVLGAYGGVVQLGARSGDGRWEVGYLENRKIDAHISIATPDQIEIIPTKVTIGSLAQQQMMCAVSLAEVQFIAEEIGLDWCDGDADTDRHIVDKGGDTLIVRTASRATFAHYPLPTGSGRIDGILNKFNRRYQLTVVDNYMVFLDKERF